MLTRVSTILCLFLFAASCFAQSNLVFYDAGGSRAGSLVQFVEDSSCDNGLTENPVVSCDAMLRQDIYLTKVKLPTGEITSTGFRYESDDCTGQPYLLATVTGPRGGMLLSKGDPTDPVLVKVEWYPNFANVSLRSYDSYNGICGFSAKNELAMKPTIVDPAVYGMKVIPANGFKAIGFEGPLTPVNERGDAMFCNGFESCPTIEGPPGYTSLISQTSLDAGDETCVAGGVRIQSGIDNNPVNGTLDDVEVESVQYICNGVNQ